MLAKQRRRIEAYRRVQDFLATHPIPESPGYVRYKRALDDVVVALDDHAVQQTGGQRMRRADVARRAALCRELREDHLVPIARIARESLGDAPGIEKALRVPDYYLGPLKLVVEAGAIRQAAELYEEQFIEGGRPVDFLERLDRAIEAVRSCMTDKERSLRRHVGATSGLADQIRRGRRVVEVLDTIVKDAFRGDEPTLAEWRVARRVKKVPGGTGSAVVSDEPTVRAHGSGDGTLLRLIQGGQ